MNSANKALSIQQPWAWLICANYKGPENRTWDTKHRGWTFIHAGKKFDKEGYDWVRQNMPHIPMPEPGQFKCGGIVGRAYLGTVIDNSPDPFFFGPLAFFFEQGEHLPFLPYKGQLGFFAVKYDIKLSA